MDVIKIDDKAYRYVTDVNNDDLLRGAFNQLTREVYGFDFENWYSSGYWGDNYVPHALMHGERMISNISSSEILFSVNGQERTCIQIGTVMTHPDYRHQGLNRLLMDRVLERWRGRCDLIYLFANDTVLDFYPKFGFKPVQEYQYSARVTPQGREINLKKLDMTDKHNQALVFDIANESQPLSRVSMQGNACLAMFWLINWYADFVYYCEAFDAVVVMQYHQQELLLMDVWCKQSVELDDLLPSLLTPEIQSVVLGFTPQSDHSGINQAFSFTSLKLQPDDQLFVLDDKHGIAESHKFMFPLLSHA